MSATLAIHTPDMTDAEMGRHLTEQYHRAVGAMPEILKFGAMIMMLEEKVIQIGSLISSVGKVVHDGPLPLGRGKKGGLRDWLRTNAEAIPYATAIRFRDVTRGIAEDYRRIVGAKIANKFPITQLVASLAGDLPPEAQRGQQLLFDYVSGTSQTSWLDKIRPIRSRGGNTYDRAGGKGAREPLTPEQAREFLHDLCTRAGEALQAVESQQAHIALSDVELDALTAHCERVADILLAWRAKSQAERQTHLASTLATA